MKIFKYAALVMAAAVIVQSCNDDSTPIEPDPMLPISEVIDSEDLTINPSGYMPLGATLEFGLFPTANVSKISIKVKGKSGSQADLQRVFDVSGNLADIPVLGLYADYANTVEVAFLTSGLDLIADTVYTVQTDALSSSFPTSVTADVVNNAEPINNMLMVSYCGGNHAFPSTVDVPLRPFMIDKFGDIRWALDYTTHPTLNMLRFGHGLERLANGNLYFGDEATHKIYEIDMFGTVINTWDLNPFYQFHHEVWEKSDGNLLVSVDVVGRATIEDHVIELDRATGNVVREWDFRESLQEDRYLMHDAIQGDPVEYDWLHQNGLTWDDNDNTLIITGREQGMIKVDVNNNVVWILSPHRNWGQNGRGEDLNQFLLTPLDASNNPITDTTYLNGWAAHPDFDWAWFLHAPLVTPSGTFMAFDNGPRFWDWNNSPLYSRAVEFEIDEDDMTVKQLFEYGAGETDLFSAIVSDVDYLPQTNTVIYGGGTCNDGASYWGKSIEVDYATGATVAEYTIVPPAPLFIITFTRTEKMALYF